MDGTTEPASRLTANNLDDAPPPPYTETDIYSNPGGSTGHRANSLGDSLSSAGRSASSSGDVVYTPPLTPQSSYQQTFGGGAADAGSRVSSAAAAYFDSRPPQPRATPGSHVRYGITMSARSVPGDFPYPRELVPHDVTADDWHTFINYLLPNYSAQSNSTLIDRKLRAEGESSGSGNNNNRSHSTNNDDAHSTVSSSRSHAEAQLDQIRTPVTVDSPDATARREQAERTLREWNEGFFNPRGVAVSIQFEPGDYRVPGAWDHAFDSAAGQSDQPGGSTQQQQQQQRTGFNPPVGHPRGGFRIGGLTVGHDGISYGDSVVLDANQVRIGGFTADNNGIRLLGRQLFPSMPGSTTQRHCPAPPPFPGQIFGPHPTFGGPPPPQGPGMGPFSRSMPHIPGAFHDPRDQEGFGDDKSPGAKAGRGRGPVKGRGSHSRSSSASSVSSADSSSSGSSASSVDSLPSYDDLADAQLPAARDLLREWLAHPDQPITQESTRSLNARIRAAGGRAQAQQGAATPLVDRAALRREIKELTRQFKALKRAQRQQAKQLRRERKAQRKAEKRERRRVKREIRRAKRSLRKEARDAAREMRRSHGCRGAGDGAPAASPPGVGFSTSHVVQAPQQQQQQQQPGPTMPGFFPCEGGPFAQHGCGPARGRGLFGGGGPGRWQGGFGGFGGGFGRHGHHHGFGAGFGHAGHHGYGGGRGFGRGFGSGRRGIFGGGFDGEQQRAPGSWPAEDEAVPTTKPQDPHAASKEKFREAGEIEAQIAQLRAKVKQFQGGGGEVAAAASSSTASRELKAEDEKKRLSSDKREEHDADAAALQHEIEMLEDLVAQVRLEGDSEFAKELARQEQTNWN